MIVKPLVSIITINYNTDSVTGEMVSSVLSNLLEDTYDYEVIVVDNGSFIGDLRGCIPLSDKVTIIRSDKNLGFAGGNNLGIKAAKGDYLMFLNSDVVIENDFIEPLLVFMEDNSEVGAVSPKIMDEECRDIIEFAGYKVKGNALLHIEAEGRGQTDSLKYIMPRKTPFIHGAAFMIKQGVVKKSGYMPHEYFLYFEELDWSVKMRKAGYTLWCVPQSVVYHKGSVSTGKISPLKIYYNTRNRLLFAKRNLSGINRIYSILFQIFFSFPKNSIKYIYRGKANLAKAAMYGVADFIKRDFGYRFWA